MKPTAHFFVVLRSRKCEAIRLFPHIPSWHALGQVYPTSLCTCVNKFVSSYWNKFFNTSWARKMGNFKNGFFLPTFRWGNCEHLFCAQSPLAFSLMQKWTGAHLAFAVKVYYKNEDGFMCVQRLFYCHFW